ncbi:MAG: DUF3047 domain-containing protein [Nitrospirales bacterium]|nr:DUF3047 domain-containing protein [Nitrospira sp.]MDR4486892.1 DUF3047 domain-containing protein [Nitrospirales bacterium]
MMTSRMRRILKKELVVGLSTLVICASLGGGGLSEGYAQDGIVKGIVLEDFSKPNEKGFPQDWEAQRSTVTAHETYMIQEEEGQPFLSVKNANQRVYTKQFSWDPKQYPILTWRWRARVVPEQAEFIAAIYPSLDVDFMFIPVNTKYLWSVAIPVGTVKEGGMFSSTEMVIRSGAEPLGEWVEERINVYEDFLRIHNHEPAEKAWGISLLGGPGVEVDFGSIQVHEE